MKKNLLLTISTISLGALLMSGCSKDDTTSPLITINGASSITISKGDSYTDPGATATDDNDGTVTVTSDASATNPDVNTPGIYTITYSASDKAGNTSSESRTVIVNWKGSQLAFVYTNYEADSALGTSIPDTMAATIVGSSTDTRFGFSPVLDGAITAPVYCDIANGTHFTIASQTPNGAGSDFTVEGVGDGIISKSGTKLKIDFTIKVTQLSTGSVVYCRNSAIEN